MIKFAAITIGALAVFAIPATAMADETGAPDETAPACPGLYVASGPYCVNPLYVNNPMFTDPASCEFGYYQGGCIPASLAQPSLTASSEDPDPETATPVASPVDPEQGGPTPPTDEQPSIVWPTDEQYRLSFRHGPY